MLEYGLYEQVLNKNLKEELSGYSEETIKIDTTDIDQEEASKTLAKYTSEIIEKGLQILLDKNKDIHDQINLANNIVKTVQVATEDNDFEEYLVDNEAKQLMALLKKTNTIYASNPNLPVTRPQTSLCFSSLFTGAYHEPQMYEELKKEIVHSNRIDMLVSFVRWSGLRLILEELKEFLNVEGHSLRVITTTYTGATEPKAIAELSKLPNTKIKITYDTKRTRLHAKTYVFHRNTGFTTAYVGSSNLSDAAMTSGCEWNVKITQKDLPETVNKIEATFESYWESNEFEEYTEECYEKLEEAISREKGVSKKQKLRILTVDAYPYPYQKAILDKLDADREIRGHKRNLVVAATGTGKTIISAFDYPRICDRLGRRPKLLFVAHRKEILEQSMYTFQDVLKDLNFGDLYVDGYKPKSLDYLFISIQTLNSVGLTSLVDKNFYDFIIVDEFHHAAAKSYQILLDYFEPDILLGLTATPERTDGADILKYFDGHVSAEIRLPEAIDRKLLCPFQYFCVTDSENLDGLTWKNGGYDKRELSNIYTMDEARAIRRANLILQSTVHYVNDIQETKGLGFCVSVEHANYMSQFFNSKGIPAMALTGKSSDDDRNKAKEKLVNGEVKFIFVVDIYNEGVDIPEVNTVLFLRPTESLIVFLQQLGRGLRLCKGKECLTVLDFVGQAHKKYDFAKKFNALLNNGGSISKEINSGFVSLPRGCYLKMEKKAKEYILGNIKNYFSKKANIIDRISTFEADSGRELSLTNFLDYYQMDIRDIYSINVETDKQYASFGRLSVLAGKKLDFIEPMEEVISKAFKRLCVVDSHRWLKFMLLLLENIERINYDNLDKICKRMVNMLQFTIWQKSYEKCGFVSTLDGFKMLKQNTVMYAEFIELIKYKLEHIDFVSKEVDIGIEGNALDLHCKYSRDQILVALDYFNTTSVMQGVLYVREKNIDVLFVTLNKSEKDFSETTMYKDYAIGDTLFSWESQSTTSDTSPTGKRYIKNKSKVLLFVREYKKDMLGAPPYTFLGVAKCVGYSGSKPITIKWKLEEPISANVLMIASKLA